MTNTRIVAVGIVLMLILITTIIVYGRRAEAEKAEFKKLQDQVAAMTRASGHYQNFLAAQSGTEAVEERRRLEAELAKVGLTLGVLSIRESDLVKHIQTLYARDFPAMTRPATADRNGSNRLAPRFRTPRKSIGGLEDEHLKILR